MFDNLTTEGYAWLMFETGGRIAGRALAGLLCLLPSVAFGFPPREDLGEWLLLLPLLVLGSGLPQIAMLASIYISADKFVRLSSLWISAISVIVYFVWLNHIDLTSSSTAVLEIFFIQWLLTPIVLIALCGITKLRSIVSDVI